ncbi:uncharacterized protein LOC110831826 isoform X4 [Zootermopsis nevadensis]|uniref:uncharacterized protein LOC110831826 isoform X4 n=1 Tax=Zootermopsis nevadensis TaxID=136037 RepID=UPI000B8E8987|nr:uncharacterized protein LOC110831826 isoform X4 [Zootermopsis nevadensis]
MDFSSICRFCMAKDGPMLDIFKDAAMILKAYALLPNLKLLDDGLPNHICKHCVHQLKAAYKFKTKCEHTDTILRRHLQKAQPVNTSSVILLQVPLAACSPISPPLLIAHHMEHFSGGSDVTMTMLESSGAQNLVHESIEVGIV